MKNLSFNIEYSINFQNTINEIKYQLLDAIIYFKLNKVSIMKRQIEKCGTVLKESDFSKKFTKPIKIVQKRQVNDDFKNSNQRLHTFFFDLNQYFSNLTGFWNSVVFNVCKSSSASLNYENCWDGTNFTR